MTPAGATRVPPGWDLLPSGVTRGAFRLLFVTSDGRNGSSSDINDYNNHVISAAGAGHSAIRAYDDGFRAIASTEAVDARDNAGLTGTGVPVYWLNGARVAGNYADLLDGSWGSESWTTEAGGAASSSGKIVWTGSSNDGQEIFIDGGSRALGAEFRILAAHGNLNGGGAPLFAGGRTRTETHSLYGLSQVLLGPGPTRKPSEALEPTSRPRQGDTYELGETFVFPFVFTEPVVVRGAPTMPLQLDSGTVQARYVSGSGNSKIYFAYTVQTGDYDEDGPVVAFDKGDAYMTLHGASIRALADGYQVNLFAASDWSYPFNAFGIPHKVEARPPFAREASVSSSPQSGTTYGAGETITLSLAMNEAVRVTGRPSIWLDVGGARRRAVYSGPIGESTDALAFSYTVRSGDRDADGVSLCASGPGCGSIALNGGSIRGVADRVAAELSLPALGAQADHKVDGMPMPIMATPTACTDEIEVPSNWALKPAGVNVDGRFRLLFVTLTKHRSVSTNIADYNSLVQGRAAAGHASIRRYSAGFRVLGSTQSVNARANTCSRSSDTDAAVYWLNGAKVADNYADLYDGAWSSNADRFENGGENRLTGTFEPHVYTGTNSDGTTSDHYLGRDVPGTQISEVRLGRPDINGQELEATTRGPRFGDHRFFGLSQIFKVSAAAATTGISVISSPAIGDTHRRGETMEFEVTYSEAVDVRGTPRIGLAVSTHDRSFLVEFEAVYVRGSGTNKLVFAWDVSDRAKDSDGIQTFPNPLRLSGATITAVSDGFAAVWNIPAWRNIGGKADGTLLLEDGVCDRTAPVRDAIVAAVSAASDCAQVTDAQLAAIRTIRVKGLTSLEAGDFAGLTGMEELGVGGSGSSIETLPVGLFDGLDSLTSLSVVTGLTHLPKDIFRGLGKLTKLYLWRNAIGAGGLPDGIFEPLEGLTDLRLDPNPGQASFRPTADAGPGGTLSAGESVTLGGPGTSGGPWGSNVTHAWTQTDGEDMAASTVTLSATDVAEPSFTAPALSSATDVRLALKLTGKGAGSSSPSTAEFTIRALAPTGLAVVSKPAADDTYKLGETIEIAVTFGDRVLVNTSLGTPGLILSVGQAGPAASYVRGSGTNRLVFAYTVGDRVSTPQTDTDGISVGANAVALNRGAITSLYGAAAILDHEALSDQSGHKVDGSTPALTDGVCGRTPQVRDKLVELVKAKPGNGTRVTDCSKVTEADLNALPGTLNLRGGTGGGLGGDRLTGLKAGDFARLTGITSLGLSNNRLRDIPPGVFDPLTALTRLSLSNNGTAADDGLTALPPGLFDRLTGLTTLELDENDLSSLPPRLFEKLEALNILTLHNNPGTRRFKPTAKAGPEGGIEVASGGTVTLGVADAAAGFDDPWGANIESWSWRKTVGSAVIYASGKGLNTARPEFTAPPADETMTFELTVTGRGGSHTATDTVTVRVVADASVVPGGADICGRSPAVAAAILARVQANDSNVATCTQVTASHLATVAGTLDVSAQVTAHGRMTALKAGDFAGLTGLTGLDLDDHAIRVFPAGIFEPLTSLTELSIAYNQTQAADRMTTLPAGLFDRLTKLTALGLEHNDLETLPDRIFEPLKKLTTLTLDGNPGSASFVPVAVAGPAGGFDAKAGDPVTLGGDPGGPWGSNLVYAWRKATGTTVDPSADGCRAPTLTAPALAEAAALEYELTVTARGTSRTATHSVTVRVAATAVVSSVALVSDPVDGGDAYRHRRDDRGGGDLLDAGAP